MLIKNAEVYTQEHRFVKENVEIKNGRFSAISGEVSKDTEVVEAEGHGSCGGRRPLYGTGAGRYTFPRLYGSRYV